MSDENKPEIDTAPLKKDADDLIKEEILEAISKLPQKTRQKVLRQAYGAQFPLNITYYNQKYAMQILPDLKHMIETGDVLYYPYSNFTKWKSKTVYLYINGGVKYAVDNLDDEGKSLKTLREKIYITKDPDGVRVHYKEEANLHVLKAVRLKKDDPLAQPARITNAPDAIEEEDELSTNKWRQELMKWMETANVGDGWPNKGKEFKVSEEDFEFLQGMFESDESFGFAPNYKTMTFIVRKMI